MLAGLLGATALIAASAVSADTQQVIVGMNMTRTFTPNMINANVGDVVNFTFVAGNHTVTQSSFKMPCSQNGSLTSGFMPANVTAGKTSSFQITINDTNPIWLYCAQGNHCQQGMVMSINAPTSGNMTFTNFQAAANASGSSTSGMSSSAGMSATASASASSAATSKASSADVQAAAPYVGALLSAAAAALLV